MFGDCNLRGDGPVAGHVRKFFHPSPLTNQTVLKLPVPRKHGRTLRLGDGNDLENPTRTRIPFFLAAAATRTRDPTRVWHLSTKHGNHLILVDREALDRMRRALRRRDEGLRRPRLQALMNTSLELMFERGVVRRRVNTLCGKSAAAPNTVNTLLSRSVTLNWI